MDTVGSKVAKADIAMIKVAAPKMACQGIDWSVQTLRDGGTNNVGTARACCYWPMADGPDEVHRNQIGKLELAKCR